jgi:hypothetical protein
MAFVRDFSRIAVAPDAPDKLTPAAAQRLFDASVAWLDARFAEPHAGPTVVVTHFAPSRLSIHPRFAGSPLNACFTSDLAAHIGRWQPRLWLHGHTHDSFDYRIGATRVVCNRAAMRRTASSRTRASIRRWCSTSTLKKTSGMGGLERPPGAPSALPLKGALPAE